MIPLEKQVVSLEFAKKMKELGFKQESLFYYAHQGKIYSREHYLENYNSNDNDDQESCSFDYYLKEVNGGEVYSAYLSSELGDMLPDEMMDEHEDIAYNLTCVKTDSAASYWTVMYIEYDRGALIEIEGDTECDARAKMLILLKENNLIQLEK